MGRSLFIALLALHPKPHGLVHRAVAAPQSQLPPPAQRIVAGLPWQFNVSTQQQRATRPFSHGSSDGWAQRISYQFISAEPYRSTAQGPLFLRAELTVERFESAGEAQQAFQSLLAKAHPDVGLSYAWDHLILSGNTLMHLHAGCVFSEENFLRMVSELEQLGRSDRAGHRPLPAVPLRRRMQGAANPARPLKEGVGKSLREIQGEAKGFAKETRIPFRLSPTRHDRSGRLDRDLISGADHPVVLVEVHQGRLARPAPTGPAPHRHR